MAIDPYANCNNTIIDNNLCTLETCCLAQSSFLYIPDFGGNLFFTIFFAVLLIPHAGLGIYYKTWGFMVGMLCGLILEIIGYAARIMLHNNPFDGDAFLMYLITLTIAPVFFTAAIYLTLTRLIALYDPTASRLKPRTIAILFMTSDFASLLLQAIGGAIADTADEKSTKQSGIDIMIAGLFLQVISLLAFLTFCFEFFFTVHRKGTAVSDPAKVAVRSTTLFKLFLGSLLLATLAILVRSIFRVAELWGGFDGTLWNDENDFMIMDGAMVTLASVLLFVFHPGPAFGAQWGAADWSLRKGGKKYKKTVNGDQVSEREMKMLHTED